MIDKVINEAIPKSIDKYITRVHKIGLYNHYKHFAHLNSTHI